MAAVVALALTAGVLSERAGFGWTEYQRWLPDLAVGATLICCGAQLFPRHAGSGVLLAGAGAFWFVANAWPGVRFVHRALLVHVVVTYVGAKPRSLGQGIVVAIAYLALFGPFGWNAEASTLAGFFLVALVAAGRWWTGADPMRASAFWAMLAAVCLLVAVVAADLIRSVQAGSLVATLCYEAGVSGGALLLSVPLLAGQSSLTDVVVGLSDEPSGTLRDALAITLGDPSLVIAFWDGRGAFVQPNGQTFGDADLDGRGALRVDDDGVPVALIGHDRSVLTEPDTREAVRTATRLYTAHVRLGRQVAEQVDAVEASRRRLLTAADQERDRLDQQLRSGAERRLGELRTLLDRTCGGRRRARILELVDESLDDLRQVGLGLHPRDLDLGLTSALQALAARSSMGVSVEVGAAEVHPEHARAIFYVCSEAIANSAKHGAAGSVAICVTESGDHLRLVVSDDGQGGAEIGRGTGLAGLIDRVETLGGRLELISPPGAGTTVRVMFPLRGHRPAAGGPAR